MIHTTRVHFALPPRTSTHEYLVMLMSACRFDRLLRKDDLLDEGVAAVFGLAGEEVELLGLAFHAGKFTPCQLAAWLAEHSFTAAWIAERRFTPLVVVPIRRRCFRH